MRTGLTILAVAVLTATVRAQVSTQRTAVEPAGAAEPYRYNADGRRDPFLSLVGAGTDPHATARGQEGIAGFMLGDISVRGIMRSGEAMVGMIQGPDNKTYLVHQGDRLADGVVRTITAEGLMVMQDVSNPLSVQKQREVRKLLRSLEGSKE